jgi:hypothetical protein
MKTTSLLQIGFLSLLLALTAGCKTVSPPATAAFSTGITAAREQTDLAFKAVNQLASDTILDYAAAQPTLNEKNFFVVLEPESIAAWDRIFGVLEKYSQSLVVLTSPNLTEDYRKSALDLAQQIKDTGEKLRETHVVSEVPALSPSLSTAFTKVGEILLQAKAQADARRILRETDPHIRQAFVQMADAIGAGTDKNIRGTVRAHWVQLKAEKQAAFLSTSDAVQKRKVAVEFSELIQQQRTQDMTLASLRRSLLALADAHHALAEGQDLSVSAALAQIKAEIDDTKALYQQFEAIAKKPK